MAISILYQVADKMKSPPPVMKMPVEEVRVRLAAAVKMYPLRQISKLVKMVPNDLRKFIRGSMDEMHENIGPERLKRIAKVCLDIETGVLRWNGLSRSASKVWVDEAIRAPSIVHRVMFERHGPALLKGSAPENTTMPSFAKLFGSKPQIVFPKLGVK
jgi:hypothetical protein